MTSDIRELRGEAGMSWADLIAPLRARGQFFPEFLDTYEQRVSAFVRAATPAPSERAMRLAAELMGEVGGISIEAEFQDEATKAILEAATSRLRALLESVLGSAEPWEL